MYVKGSILDQYLIRGDTNIDLITGGITGGKECKSRNANNDPGFNPLTHITLDKTECINDANDDGVCAPDKVVDALKKFVNEKVKSVDKLQPKAILDLAKNKLGCKTEACVYKNSTFQKFVSDNNIMNPNYLKSTVLQQYIKPPGPRDSLAWLDNINIDDTLAIWAREFSDFYPYSFNMVDFEGPVYYGMEDTGQKGFYKGSLERVHLEDILNGNVYVEQGPGFEPVKRPCKRMGCVLNTDTSTGTGEHWVALFIDCSGGKSGNEPWTVEYFNSSGNFPPQSVDRFMTKAEQKLMAYQRDPEHDLKNGVEVVKSVAVTQHQQSNSECGLYSLFYIRSRLEGKPYEYFQDHVIEDCFMTEFRKYLFSEEEP